MSHGGSLLTENKSLGTMPDGSYWRSGECKQMYNGVIKNFYRNCEDINEYTTTPPINSVPNVPNKK